MGTLIFAGCAKGDPPPAAPTHAHFAKIQRQEARIAEAQAAVRREMAAEAPACARACAAWGDATRASAALCDVASQVDDADAQARCHRGRATCTEIHTRVTAGCPCEEGSDPS